MSYLKIAIKSNNSALFIGLQNYLLKKTSLNEVFVMLVFEFGMNGQGCLKCCLDSIT
jgi:hypothetical protein